MGFLGGVVTGIAAAAVGAAWYMSRSGERFRDQYRVERRLGELGDQLEARTRDIQSTVNAQLAEMRAKGREAATVEVPSTNGHDLAPALDAAAAGAAEAAARTAAEADALTAKVAKAITDVATD